MSDTLTQVLLQEIAKNMPSMVGDELKKRLIKADADAEKAGRLSDEIPPLRMQIEEQGVKLRHFQELNTSVLTREKAIAEKEQTLAIREAVLKGQEEAASGKVKHTLDVLDKIFRERSVLHSLSANIPYPVPNGSYINSMLATGVVSSTEK